MNQSMNSTMLSDVSMSDFRDGYSYNRAQQDNRFKMLSEKQDDETEAGLNGRRLPLKNVISNYDRKLLEYIVNLNNVLRADKISVDQFKDAVEAIKFNKHEQENEYLRALLYPERSKGAKIPSTIPVPSSSFQLRSSVTVSTNATGNAAIIFNPFHLEVTGSTTSTFYVNNNATLTGAASDNNFLPVNIGQTIPPVYNEYRLVSASIVVKYVGRLDIVQGVIGGSIIFDNSIIASNRTLPAANANLQKYGDFNIAMDSYYTQENLSLNGMRCLYFPIDVTYEQYYPVGTANTGFGFLIYILGGVPSSASYKVDIYCNFECLADPTFLNYLPSSMCSCADSESKQEAIKTVQQQPITDDVSWRSNQQSSGGGFWDSLKNTFGSLLPGITEIVGTIYPAVKPVGIAMSQILNNKSSFVPGGKYI